MERCCQQLNEEITINNNGVDINGKTYALNEEEKEIVKKIQIVTYEIIKNESISSPIIYCILKKRAEKLTQWQQLDRSTMEAALEETERYPELIERVKRLLEKIMPLLCESKL